MASYKFPCCGQIVFVDDEQLVSIFVEHNCQGVPCMAQAAAANGFEPAAEDVATPELDAALDLVAGGTEDPTLVPAPVTVDTPAPTE
jgi:hypothetical protein